jgi:TIR domain/SIR2-like domain
MAVSAIGAMRDGDWTSLTSSIENGRCILMLGPGAFIADFDGEVLPVGVALARFIKERLGPEHANLDPFKPWSVAQAAVATEDASTVTRWAEEFYEQYDTVSDALKNLASLPFQLVINTSVGLSAEKAFHDAKSQTYADYYDRTGQAREHLPDPSTDAPVVYNLFGSVAHPSSMILSENDRLDFLISIISENPPLPPKLTSTLCDPRQSFLFLGFNLGQWQLKMLMYAVLRRVQRDNKSFALELQRDDLDEDAILFYLSGHKVHFVDVDLSTLTNELRTRVRQRPAIEEARPGEAVHPSKAAPTLDAPTVFICHAHEDAAFAEGVCAGLRENNINVWLDKDSLRGGDEWDRAIERTLEEEVQYVVVLQSAGLKAKEIGYVNKEINLAIQRQAYFRPPRIFLIPTIIDSSENRLDELTQFQSVDLTSNEGINALVRTIKRDVDAASRSR